MGIAFSKGLDQPENFDKLESVNPKIHDSIEKMTEKAHNIAEMIKNRKKFIDRQLEMEWEKYNEEESASRKKTKERGGELEAIREEIEKLEITEASILGGINNLVAFYESLANDFKNINSNTGRYADAQGIKSATLHENSEKIIDGCSSTLNYFEAAINKMGIIKKQLFDKIKELNLEKINLYAIKEGLYSEENVNNQENKIDKVYKDIVRLAHEKDFINEEIGRQYNKANEERKILEKFNSKIEQ